MRVFPQICFPPPRSRRSLLAPFPWLDPSSLCSRAATLTGCSGHLRYWLGLAPASKPWDAACRRLRNPNTQFLQQQKYRFRSAAAARPSRAQEKMVSLCREGRWEVSSGTPRDSGSCSSRAGRARAPGKASSPGREGHAVAEGKAREWHARTVAHLRGFFSPLRERDARSVLALEGRAGVSGPAGF